MNKKTWFRHYDQGVPTTLMSYPARTLMDVFFESAIQRPNHAALLFQGKSLSSALSDLGVKPGDRVGFLLPNAPQIGLAGWFPPRQQGHADSE